MIGGDGVGGQDYILGVMSLLSLAPTFALGRRPSSRVAQALVAAFVMLVSALSFGATWSPPPLDGHVVDQAGALAEQEKRTLDHKLDAIRKQTGFAIVVYLLPSLPDGLSIEDVGYKAGKTWGVGSASGDDGVVLVASLGERKLRIETGKGGGGALPDITASKINREIIGPLMKEGRTYEAMNRGVDAIVHELVANTDGGKSVPGRAPSANRAKPMGASDYVRFGVIGLVILGVIVLAFVSPTFRQILFFMLLFGRGGGGGGSGGGGGGSGYRGGGGDFGGGGSSDDY